MPQLMLSERFILDFKPHSELACCIRKLPTYLIAPIARYYGPYWTQCSQLHHEAKRASSTIRSIFHDKVPKANASYIAPQETNIQTGFIARSLSQRRTRTSRAFGSSLPWVYQANTTRILCRGMCSAFFDLVCALDSACILQFTTPKSRGTMDSKFDSQQLNEP